MVSHKAHDALRPVLGHEEQRTIERVEAGTSQRGGMSDVMEPGSGHHVCGATGGNAVGHDCGAACGSDAVLVHLWIVAQHVCSQCACATDDDGLDRRHARSLMGPCVACTPYERRRDSIHKT